MSTPATITRPVRTAGQATVGWIVTEGIDAFLYDMNDRQYGVLLAGLTVLFSWVQVQVENYTDKGLLRNPDDRDE